MNTLFKCLCSLLEIGILIPIAPYNVQTHIKTNKPQEIRKCFLFPRKADFSLFISQVNFVMFCNVLSDKTFKTSQLSESYRAKNKAYSDLQTL